jgi:hypothetical protein
VPEDGGGRRLVRSLCAPFAGCVEKRGLGRWVESERNRRGGVSRLPRGPSDDARRVGERSRQGARRRVERRALPLEGGSQRVCSSEHIVSGGRETVRGADEAAGVSAGRADKLREAERAVLAASSGGESHLYSCRLGVGQGAHSRSALVI